MATAVHIPVSEYLATSYRPDCDYVDGEVQERHLGSRPHSFLQTLLWQWFEDRYEQSGFTPMVEMRLRVSPQRLRVPDVCLVAADANEEDDAALQFPPVVCIEVLSPEDRLPRLQERVDDYVRMGVPNVWVIDPVSHQVWIANDGTFGPFAGDMLPVQGLDLSVDLPAIFAKLEKRLHPSRP